MAIKYNGPTWLIDSQAVTLALKSSGKFTAVYEDHNDLSQKRLISIFFKSRIRPQENTHNQKDPLSFSAMFLTLQ